MMKECKKCKTLLPKSDEYFYKEKTKDGHSSWCKQCRRVYQNNYRNSNKEVARERTYKHYKQNKKQYDDRKREWMREHRQEMKEYMTVYQKQNPDKMREYNKRRENKKHQIQQSEWVACKRYFYNCCAYCGLSEKMHRDKFGKDLHKEHVIHDGRNDLKNCVPSCKSCNSEKNVSTLNEWYNKCNVKFTQERYYKICEWIMRDCKKYIKKKRKKYETRRS